MSFLTTLFKNKDSTSPNQCPYCGYRLDKLVKRKTKCCNCSKFIFVRNGKMLTEQEANLFDIKKLLVNIELQDYENLKTMDEMWGYLNSMLLKSPSQREDLYFIMSRICFVEKRFKSQIMYLMYNGHFASKSCYQDMGSSSSEFKNIDFLEPFGLLETCGNSLKELGLPNDMSVLKELNRLSVNPNLTLKAKEALLEEFFEDPSVINVVEG